MFQYPSQQRSKVLTGELLRWYNPNTTVWSRLGFICAPILRIGALLQYQHQSKIRLVCLGFDHACINTLWDIFVFIWYWTCFISDEWRYRHAGLMAISAVGEGCHKFMEEKLGGIVEAILPFFQDTVSRSFFPLVIKKMAFNAF